MKLGSLEPLAYSAVLIGGLNWGLVGLLNLNLVEAVLGSNALLVKLVYLGVGSSAALLAPKLFMKK